MNRLVVNLNPNPNPNLNPNLHKLMKKLPTVLKEAFNPLLVRAYKNKKINSPTNKKKIKKSDQYKTYLVSLIKKIYIIILLDQKKRQILKESKRKNLKF